ncbi:hypothetical protein [Bacillus pinisoli]|uniref:hypothetical protein n=1 Tax=Bacillus pinisoli TaxID=2901866 RepID=UPI001FF69B9C|nr:hypothetical protein [Bacillus pinisoli]
MYLFLSIILATLLGYLLLLIHPLIGGVLAFGIVAGGLVRGVYLLNNINRRLNEIAPESDRVQKVYEAYLKEKNEASS